MRGMRIVMFYHSLVSDWNHGNAHFLRGIARELIARGHDVRIYEPRNGWSISNLLSDYGKEPLLRFKNIYPGLESSFYVMETLDLDRELDGADIVIVHEWNDAELVRRIGEHRMQSGRYRLLFHDTHHRSVTAPAEIAQYRLSNFDGVLAYGGVIRDLYLEKGWAHRAWTWHEAADEKIFRPMENAKKGDLVWIGNWGDGERSEELREFFICPAKELRLNARAYGVRYPLQAISELADAGIEYSSWLPNYAAPAAYAQFRATIHIPRRPYTRLLPGIPTIRVFEALACGIPLICSPWEDAESLFHPGTDFLIAKNGREIKEHLTAVLNDRDLAARLSANGLKTVLSRHTCSHRVDELLSICHELGVTGADPERSCHAA